MEIFQASQSNFEIVKSITQKTIITVYPKYYPAGAVQFFSAHHSDEHIEKDIADGKVYLLKNEEGMAGTVTVNENAIQRLFVLPECQHRGFGRKLLDFAEKLISDKYDTAIIDASFPAKRIYLKRGYAEKEYNIIETGNGDFLCYDVMSKEL